MGAVSTLSFSIASTAGFLLAGSFHGGGLPSASASAGATTLASEVHANGDATSTVWKEDGIGEVSERLC